MPRAVTWASFDTNPSRMNAMMTIGRLAGSAQVTAGTIRYYERIGLLPKPGRTPAGYRQYPASVVHRLTLIRNAQQFGFSLRDIASFLRVRDDGGTPCQNVRRSAERMLAAVDTQIAELRARRRQMARTLKRWDERLVHTRTETRAYLLEMLDDKGATPDRRRSVRT
jgi:DNA-binding transcriptional MerR regulator